ncbi:MAG: DUF547 domain-containing protein [Balneolaceae bacterium]|nr:MAG: DUF547 domain-containing protein [Balneolaceae bacterium]
MDSPHTGQWKIRRNSPVVGLLYLCILFSACAGTYPVIPAAGCNVNEFDDLTGKSTDAAIFSMLLVENVRDGLPVDEITDCLANMTMQQLQFQLNTEEKKKAFWLNVYNAYVQILLLETPELFDDRNSWFGYNFFSTPQVVIAGRKLSFDDMEHGIMRRSTHKLTMGYMKSFRIPEIEKQLWWNEIDPRIHFALNCGAASCPYIAVYEPGRVDEQLDMTTKNYLSETTHYDSERDRARVTRLMSWFRGDFGGLSGAKEMLRQYGIIPEDSDPKLSFLEYDWTLELGNYQDL